nr:ion transporter [Rhizobium halophytocola]
MQSNRFERLIIAIILINSVTLGLATNEAVMASAGPLIDMLDHAILAIFGIEIVARLFTFRARFFRDPWSIFDFVIVGLALIPAVGPFQIVRTLRIMRLLRLISILPSLRRVIGGLVLALPGMGSVVILLALLMYVAAVMATTLYGAQFPDWFGTIGASLYTLFQVMTLESWSMGIVRPVMEVSPHAWLFFVPFILLSTYSVLNLVIGVIVSAMQQEGDIQTDAELQSLHGDNTTVLKELRALRAEISGLRRQLERGAAQ